MEYDAWAKKFYEWGLKWKAAKSLRLFTFGKVGQEKETLKKRVDLIIAAEVEQRNIKI